MRIAAVASGRAACRSSTAFASATAAASADARASSFALFSAAFPSVIVVSRWVAAMVPFAYVVHTLLVGLKEAIASEGNPKVATMLTQVCTRHSFLPLP